MVARTLLVVVARLLGGVRCVHGRSGRRRPARRCLAFCAIVCVVVGASSAQAQAGQWFTTPQVLRSFFAASARVSYVDVDAAALKAQGIATTRAKHHVYVGYGQGGAVDGYAVVDDEIGQHEPISFAVLLSKDLVVQRVEVMVYREAYGAEIRSPRYLKQWVGKRASDIDVRSARGVDAISGATLSSRSTVNVVRRALALAALASALVPTAPTTAPTAPPSTTAPPTTTTPPTERAP